MRHQSSRALAVCLLAASTLLRAQAGHAAKDAPSARKLVAISVTGTARFTPEEIIAASGLEIGSSASEDDFKKAIELFGNTGLFANAAYSYSFSSAGTKLDLQLADNDRLVPVHFENFVWFSDQALIQKIHENLPLFKGQVPAGGNLCDRVSDVLQALLFPHAASGLAEYIRERPDNGPIEGVLFRASNVNIHIARIEFPGATPADLPALDAAGKPLVGRSYLRSEVAAFANDRLRPVFLDRGFLKATFAEPQARVEREGDEETLVDVALPVDPGRQYKLDQVEWAGNKALPAEKLQPLLHLQPKQPANALQLKSDLEAVRGIYATLGYMAVSVTPEPAFDEVAGTVAYRLRVNEGEVYKMGDLDIRGVDSKTADRITSAWTLGPTDAYDQSYAKGFAGESLKLLSANADWSVSVQEAVNDKDKTVDVTLRYTMKASR